MSNLCYDAFALTDESHARGTLGLYSIIQEDANYELDQTQDTGSGSCGSGKGRRAGGVCSVKHKRDWQVL